MFPVDSIKVRLGTVSFSCTLMGLTTPFQTRMQVFATNQAAIYTGVGNAFSRISSTEGLRALWRGVNSVIMGAGPAHAVHFGMYEAVKELTGGNRGGNQFMSTGRLCWLDHRGLECVH